jgi:hypothetical protein
MIGVICQARIYAYVCIVLLLFSVASPASADVYYKCPGKKMSVDYSEVSIPPSRQLTLKYEDGTLIVYSNSQISSVVSAVGKIASVTDKLNKNRSISLMVSDTNLQDPGPYALIGWLFRTISEQGPLLQLNKGDKLDCFVSSVDGTNKEFHLGGMADTHDAYSRVTLYNNATDSVTLGADGPFIFPRTYQFGTKFNVTAQSGPNQSCQLTNSTGILTDDVTNIGLNCYCNPGFGSCGNGACVVDLRHDVNNCGACGAVCGAGKSCIEGVCAGNKIRSPNSQVTNIDKFR